MKIVTNSTTGEIIAVGSDEDENLTILASEKDEFVMYNDIVLPDDFDTEDRFTFQIYTYDGTSFVKNSEAVARKVRITRNEKLRDEVDPIAENALRWASLPEEDQQAWATYRQALLDVPQQDSFPDQVVWPTKP